MRENARMKWLKKILLWFAGFVCALALAFVGLHVYYRLTPVELSEEAKTLLAETAHMAQLTDNGYRLHGLLAPEGMDPVEYGKCYVQTWTKLSKERNQLNAAAGHVNDEHHAAYVKRIESSTSACLNGKQKLPGVKAPRPVDIIKPGFQWAARAALDDTSYSPIYFERWDAILNGGMRGGDPDPINTPFPQYTPIVSLERARLTKLVKEWSVAKTNAERLRSVNKASAYVPKLVAFADGTLVESMIGVAVLSQHLLVAQAAAAREAVLSDAIASLMRDATLNVDRLPRAVSNAVGAEFQFARVTADWVSRDGLGEESLHPFIDSVGRFAYDKNDTLNLMAMANRDAQALVLAGGKKSFEDSRIYAFANNLGCPSLGEFAYACLPFERNATGRVLAAIALPAYSDYGLRAYDVINLAAVTRLTIEARRRGLQGDALVQFVATAPENMRDVYSGKPFAYDAAKKKLTIELRTRSTVLGEKSYELSL
jgi:hypothetical protein